LRCEVCTGSDNILSPDRWDNLPAAVHDQPGLLSNLLTFSGGPRVCRIYIICFGRPAHGIPVLRGHAILNDRDEDFLVRSLDTFRV
jgi:hypothetical protein